MVQGSHLREHLHLYQRDGGLAVSDAEVSRTLEVEDVAFRLEQQKTHILDYEAHLFDYRRQRRTCAYKND